SAAGTGLSKHPPLTPNTCSFLVAFALSPPACVLCLRAEADPDLCGPKLNNQGMRAHHFCLVSSSGIHPEGTEQEGQMGFLPEDIRCAVEQVCFVCGERGATITCQEMGCDRRFHLPCAVEGGCASVVGGQQHVRTTVPEAQTLQCQAVPL
uniref:PHD-type domain-containing protein n=1 Tax=Strigops habroptila TaxID=2489341 RepID=A0A672UD53_STRHB